MEVPPLHTATSGLQRPPACLSNVDHALPFLTRLCATHPHHPCRPHTRPPAHALRHLRATHHLPLPTATSLTPLPPRPSRPSHRVHCMPSIVPHTPTPPHPSHPHCRVHRPPAVGPSLIQCKYPPPCPCHPPMLTCHLPCTHATFPSPCAT